jgi:hypothetical protein
MVLSEIAKKVEEWTNLNKAEIFYNNTIGQLETQLKDILEGVGVGDITNLNTTIQEWCDRRKDVLELLNFQTTLDGLKDELEGLTIPGPSQIPGNLCTFPPI